MEIASFTTNPRSVEEFLNETQNGKLQLPYFLQQYSWVMQVGKTRLLSSTKPSNVVGSGIKMGCLAALWIH